MFRFGRSVELMVTLVFVIIIAVSRLVSLSLGRLSVLKLITPGKLSVVVFLTSVAFGNDSRTLSL